MTTQQSISNFGLTQVTDVRVVDWADAGEAFEVLTEDGPRCRTPDHALHVVVEDARGDLFVFVGPASPSRYEFATEAAAQRFRDRVAARGAVDLEYWAYWRTVYGSPAYVEDGHEEALHALGW
jgi:hypothetical protein